MAAFEIMGANLRVRDIIINGESEGKTFYDIIDSSRPFGMMTFEQSISELFKNGLITQETAVSYATRKAIIGRYLDSIKAERGEKTTSIEDLSLDSDYGKSDEI